MFKGNFIEGIEGEGTLEEMDGVVSPRSLENLLEWIYREKISFASTEYQDVISEILEFLRLADMCDVHGMEQVTADYLEDMFRMFKYDDRPANIILPQHIAATGLLPDEHPFRLAMAKCLIRPFVEDYRFQFFDELSQLPEFSIDFLKLVRDMLRNGECRIKIARSYCGDSENFCYQDSLFVTERNFSIERPREKTMS